MEINYHLEDDLNWNNSEFIDIKPKGWKSLRIKFIDGYPFVFWRIDGIDNNFRSNSDLISRKGAERFFSENLEALKTVITHELDSMPEERKKFYQENIIGLFDE